MNIIKKTLGILTFLLCVVSPVQVRAGTIFNSPYVTFSPDGQAFTTNENDRNIKWEEEGTVIDNDISSNIRDLNKGEHYYLSRRNGTVPVSKWEVVYQGHTCIHNSYSSEFHGIEFTSNGGCGTPNYSGWTATCADCGENCTNGFIYMSLEAAKSLQYLDMSKAYYYLCPFDRNLEQGYQFNHLCKEISWNKYQVIYHKNGAIGGYMAPTTHMYNNQSVYEGAQITPDTKLRKNAFTRLGYEFLGWNTKPDGSGESYEDNQEILNLTTSDISEDSINGKIHLHAQWKQTTNTLEIDPAGGSYNGNTSVAAITQGYGTTYSPNASQVKPPRGATVSFDSRGGSPVAPVTGKQTFKEWSMGKDTDFLGTFVDNTYTYLGPDGHTDRLTAVYTRNSITLPSPVKDNASFAGWYLEPDGGSLIGYAGDKITPTENITLYARWVTLLLTATDDYTSNQKKGAVDLVWMQPDLHKKTFILRQRREGEDWKQLLSASETGSSASVSKTFKFSGKKESFRVPYTGFFNLTAYGAQGGNFGAFTGGKGGEAKGRFWLEAGEMITYNIGGQNGYNGGGSGKMFSNGGGCTTVSSDRKGILLIAGGGGSATSWGEGGAGGSTTSNVENSGTGASGGAGGGGGYRGGKAGEYIIHNHTKDCYRIDVLDYTVYRAAQGTEKEIMNRFPQNASCWFEGDGYQRTMVSITDGITISTIARGDYGDRKGLGVKLHLSTGSVLTAGNTTLELHAWMDSWNGFSYYDSNDLGSQVPHYFPGQNKNHYLEVTDQSGRSIFKKTLNDIGNKAATATSSGWAGGDKPRIDFNETIALPDGTTSITIHVVMQPNNDGHCGINLTELKLSGGEKKTLKCLYADKPDGAEISSRPAYGGSSYINTELAVSYSDRSGVRTGSGGLVISGSELGYQMANRLEDAAAPDLAPPDAPRISKDLKAVGTDSVQVSWSQPQDRGTKYYHQVTSYAIEGGSLRQDLTSNITENILATGIKGYYTYLSDTEGHSPSARWHYQDVAVNWTAVTLKNNPQFLHVAAVDVAGNLSEAASIRIEAAERQDANWSVATGPVTVRQEENVWHDPVSGDYYIRADGITPFAMGFKGTIHGTATKNYQIDRMEFTISGQETELFSIKLPKAAAFTTDTVTYTGGFERTATEPEYFSDAAYTLAERSNRLKDVEILQKFTAAAKYSGERLHIIPGAMADTTVSDRGQDQMNGLYVVLDGEGPEISGLEQLEKLDMIDRGHENILLELRAADSLSGLREMTVYIQNTDNYCEQTYTADQDGRVEINITQDNTLFTGDFSIIVLAADNVGNVHKEAYRAVEFFLNGEIVRILEPHDPVFKCGESGILTFHAGGYVDRVEVRFPAAINTDQDYNTVYTYEIPDYIQEESIRFMVPLSAPENAYYVTVTAFKEGREIKSIELPFTVEGTVLDDFRTRLR